MTRYVRAKYVSVWDKDGARVVITLGCEFDMETKELIDVDTANEDEVSGLNELIEEYVLLDNDVRVYDFWVVGNQPESLF